MTQFKSQYGLCLTATKDSIVITSDECGKEGTHWSIIGTYGNCTIHSQYDFCLTAYYGKIISGPCAERVLTPWHLVDNQVKSLFQKTNPCLAATSDRGSNITSDACSNPGSWWTWAPGEETAEIAKTNSESLLIGEDSNVNISIT